MTGPNKQALQYKLITKERPYYSWTEQILSGTINHLIQSKKRRTFQSEGQQIYSIGTIIPYAHQLILLFPYIHLLKTILQKDLTRRKIRRTRKNPEMAPLIHNHQTEDTRIQTRHQPVSHILLITLILHNNYK